MTRDDVCDQQVVCNLTYIMAHKFPDLNPSVIADQVEAAMSCLHHGLGVQTSFRMTGGINEVKCLYTVEVV